ncbi:phosphodiester glycosidase family protein [Actibacterium sp. XHP0104]|uniref:phosphodiester glycosidase family protein n=1 Tax=Actibacterium sp. XHP0104 TaxID=2984335 RepID=UPI0021E7F9A3|nr:phosphodiester glycosidase family protein [Actibacterium sp. XHP0104]MCV2881929.1 phosphodiester glycosidase family protein [Actibacterium sp. XHP0104]
MTRLRRLALTVLAGLMPAIAHAGCAEISHQGQDYVACRYDPASADLRLFHRGAHGQVLGSFGQVNHQLAAEGKKLAFAMNAGMYHPDRSVVGLYIENRQQARAPVTRAGPGNFGLLPNGVLCLTDDAAQVIETRTYAAAPPDCRYATQSGPMLVIDGALHPRFLPDSDSRHIRNGVGVKKDGTVVFAISQRPVTFHEFGRLFRDRLNTPNALFLDGRISRLYAPELGRNDLGLPLGPIVGVAVPR